MNRGKETEKFCVIASGRRAIPVRHRDITSQALHGFVSLNAGRF
jgi:hypothetical protein